MKFFKIVLVLFVMSGGLLIAQEEAKKDSEVQKIFLSKTELSLEVLIEAISKVGPEEYRNKIILYDSTITKSTAFKIIKSKSLQLDMSDPYAEFRMIESFLSLNGYAVVPSSPYLLVVKSSVAPQYNIKILSDDESKNTHIKHDEIAAKMLNTVHVPSAEVTRQLQQFFTNNTTKDVQFLQLPTTNGIMILGPKSTISFLASIIKILDVPGEVKRIEIIKVNYTLPKELTAKIKDLRGQPAPRAPGAVSASGPILIPDDRTMQIIVKGTDEEIKEIKDLLLLLDQEIANAKITRDIQFLKLKNAKAEEVAATLNNLYSRIKETLPAAGTAPGAQPRAVVTPGQQTRDDIPTIVAEKTINALLVIGASSDEYRYLTEIVELLDKRRDQVMIVGTIVEMSETKAWDLAVELAAINASKINSAGTANPFGASNFGRSTISLDGDRPGRVPNVGSAFVTGFTYGSQDALPFILNASQTDSEVNSIAQPSITANDNQQATISITRSVPYETTSTGTNQVTSTNVQFKDAPISLQIKPTINAPDRVDAEKYVILEVNVNVTTLDFSQLSAGGSPGSNTRSATTVVTVPDKGVVVIGGLSGFSSDRGEKKVPILGEIPLLGNLFKSQNRNKTKSNIYIFLSPNIMTNFREAEDYARDKGILFDSDKQFYKTLKNRLWSDNSSSRTKLTDADFYPKKYIPQK